MIPKIIHYCWLSDAPVPEELLGYMATWRNVLPDYEFVKWDFSRFDKNSSVWVQEAFENKKYAFAADYIRMYALYTMGGIYLDMDVEVLKSFNDLLNYEYFVCWQNSKPLVPEVAAFGTTKGCEWVGRVLSYYKDRHFVDHSGTFDTKTLPSITRDVLSDSGYNFVNIETIADLALGGKKDLLILPDEYFSPKSYQTGKISKTNNTYCIHQFSGSWLPWEQRLEMKIWHLLGLQSHLVTRRVERWLGRIFHFTR